MTESTGNIPPSDVLSEVSLDSLSEAISRFDSAVQAGTQSSPAARRDLSRIIQANREQRERWEAAEKDRPARGQKVPLGKRSSTSASDLGL